MIVTVEHVTKRFDGLTALSDVSLDLNEGEILGLIGPNGAGKTVLQNCIAGATRPDAGRIHVAGYDTTGLPAESLCHLGLSRTFQNPHPFPRMTVLDTVLVATIFGGPDHLSMAKATTRARDCLETVHFTRSPDTPTAHLNTTELKRLDLARAIASRPRVVLLDELAAGLMSGQLDDLITIIRQIRDQGLSILMVEHVMRTIMALCDRVVVLMEGKLLAQGTPAEVARDQAVVDAYLGTEHRA